MTDIDTHNIKGVVSIIIPVYNMEDYLAKCLDSVIRQSYTNLDIIAVNDGSTDTSLSILEQYAQKDSRIRVISQKNGGLSAARNTALASLKPETEYVFFLDSDDWLPDNAIGLLVNCIEQKQADIACGIKVSYNIDGDFLKSEANFKLNDENVISRRKMFELLVKKLRSKYTHVTGKLYCRAVLSGFLFPIGKFYEDSSCHRLYGKCNRIAFLNEVVYNYLKRPGSIVNSGYDIRRLDKVELFVDRVKYLREEGFPELSTLCLGQAYLLMREILIRIPELTPDVLERVKQIRKLLSIEYHKSSLSFLSFKKRLYYWMDNYLFWVLFHRRKHHYDGSQSEEIFEALEIASNE